jgi:hypothetical protein
MGCGEMLKSVFLDAGRWNLLYSSFFKYRMPNFSALAMVISANRNIFEFQA